MRIYLKTVKVERFRNFRDVEFSAGKKITLISGQNGVGKSTLLSLIASGSGLSGKGKLHNNFQPLFTEYFKVDPKEDFETYRMYSTYGVSTEEDNESLVTKRLSLKNDTKNNRGIRIIPRTVNHENRYKTDKEAEDDAKTRFGIGPAGRVKIPTIYLSISRLHPLGELNEKEDITPEITPCRRGTALYAMGIDELFHSWYNSVIPNTIQKEGGLSLVDKKVSPRLSLHMDMKNIPLFSQSVGQDNVGNIISALLDVHIQSSNPDYAGAVVCIDEIDVSLHPDTQIKMLQLLDFVAGNNKVQFFLTTHSLTIIEEVLRKQKRCPDDYSVVYFKNPSAPMLTTQTDFNLLKEDLFGKSFYQRPKVKMYFEDEVGAYLFRLLIAAFSNQFSTPELEANPERKELLDSLNLDIHGELSTISQMEPVVMELGCEVLLKLNDKDQDFQKKVFVLDGDARYVNVKPKIKDFLNESTDKLKGVSERKVKHNVCFLPTPFAPESFLYRIIYQVTNNPIDHQHFWRMLDLDQKTALYTPDKIKNLIQINKDEYTNDDIKKLFGSNDSLEKRIQNNDLWKFVISSQILSYYYSYIHNLEALLKFVQSVVAAYNWAYRRLID